MPPQAKVIEIEPTWLLVCLQGTKPAADKRAFVLHQALRDWLGNHPGRAIRRTMPIQEGGELVGVHVWLGDAPTAKRRQFPAKIHYRLVDRLPAEHIEALLHDSYEIFFEHDGADALAVISRGGNAVVFDRAAERCYLLPLDEMRNLDKGAAEKLREWQSQPAGNYFVMELAGFEAAEDE